MTAVKGVHTLESASTLDPGKKEAQLAPGLILRESGRSSRDDATSENWKILFAWQYLAALKVLLFTMARAGIQDTQHPPLRAGEEPTVGPSVNLSQQMNHWHRRRMLCWHCPHAG